MWYRHWRHVVWLLTDVETFYAKSVHGDTDESQLSVYCCDVYMKTETKTITLRTESRLHCVHDHGILWRHDVLSKLAVAITQVLGWIPACSTLSRHVWILQPTNLSSWIRGSCSHLESLQFRGSHLGLKTDCRTSFFSYISPSELSKNTSK